jgi:hypothetical protein
MLTSLDQTLIRVSTQPDPAIRFIRGVRAEGLAHATLRDSDFGADLFQALSEDYTALLVINIY